MYATAENVIERYGDELWGMVGDDDAGELKTDVIERALSDASEEIDLHLRGRYQLPLISVPGVLIRICVDIASGLLPTNGAEESELVAERAKTARALLSKIGSGKVDLGVAEINSGRTGGDVLTHNVSSPFANLEYF